MYRFLAQKKKCAVPCKESCCSGTEDEPSFVTWAPTLVYAPSSVNASGKDVWNLFYSSNQNSHMGDHAFNGITWAVSTTESMLGPYVDVPSSKNGATLPAGGEGVVNVAVNESHSFSAWCGNHLLDATFILERLIYQDRLGTHIRKR